MTSGGIDTPDVGFIGMISGQLKALEFTVELSVFREFYNVIQFKLKIHAIYSMSLKSKLKSHL